MRGVGMSGSIRQIVAKNIRRHRLLKGMSQEKLAKASGLSLRFIARAENQPQNLTLDSLDQLSRALGIAVADLVAEPRRSAKAGLRAASSIDDAIRALQAYRTTLE